MISSAPPVALPHRICLILEGSSRFASDGVSTWVGQMVESMPGLQFSLHYIGDEPNTIIQPWPQPPANVRTITTSCLSGTREHIQSRPGHATHREKQTFHQLLRSFLVTDDTHGRLDTLCTAATVLRDDSGRHTMADLLQSGTFPGLVEQFYQEHAPQPSVAQFEATIRDLATALWQILHTATRLPQADVYHCVSSPQAGLLGALASRLNKAPLLLSEQGAPLMERIEHIRRASPIAGQPGLTAPFDGDLGTCKNLWIDFLELASQLAHAQARCSITTFQHDAQAQVALGARPDHVAVIPNGIDTASFTRLAREKLREDPYRDHRVTVGFLGPIVPIKDLKTLLRAARLVLKTHPETRFLLAGPTNADTAYFEECLVLAARLGISQSIEFPGPMMPEEFLRRTDIVTLTSIGEGMPFPLLQASGAGQPVVATDVGACREMIAEPLPSHPTLGPAGIITELASPISTATALNQLIGSPELRFEQGMNGLRRVQSAYRQEDVVDRYHKLYHALAALAAGRLSSTP